MIAPKSMSNDRGSVSGFRPVKNKDQKESAKRPYAPPVLTYLGQITAVTLGSGGTCLDGIPRTKKPSGAGSCPQDTTGATIITSEGAAASSWGFSADS